MEPPTSSRRRFLKGAAGAGAGALAIGNLSGGAAAQSLSGLDLPLTAVIGESGVEITNQQDPNNWHEVEFSNPLVNLLNLIGGPPAVIMKPPSYRGPQPVHIRLRNVTTSGFEYKLEEWNYEDGHHAFEKTFWVAIAPVTGQIPTVSGLVLNMQTGAASVDTNGTGVDFNLATERAFDSRPIALAQSQTYNGQADSIVTRVDGVEKEGFGVRLQEQESNLDYHQSEVVKYVAMEVPGGGGLLDLSAPDLLPDIGLPPVPDDLLSALGLDSLQDLLATEFEARRPTRPIQDSPEEAGRIPFTKVNNGDGFSTNPRVVAQMQTRRGPQPANLRRTEYARDHMNVFVDEEQSKDPETTHVNEDIGFLAFGSNGLIPGTILNINTGMLDL